MVHLVPTLAGLLAFFFCWQRSALLQYPGFFAELVIRNPPASLVASWSAACAVLDTIPLADMLAYAALLGRANRRRLRFDGPDRRARADGGDGGLPSAA